jgi:hypothetical protein
MGDGRGGIQDITDDLAGGVGGHAVCDEELHAINWVILGKDSSQASLDRVSFVADGEDQGYEWENLRLVQCDL